ncbi:MAG: hypothetical protein Q9P14_13335 [candidate division KSB1 bacterium]|nr:hypothetical protein [candidate division KSB1 bacterium]
MNTSASARPFSAMSPPILLSLPLDVAVKDKSRLSKISGYSMLMASWRSASSRTPLNEAVAGGRQATSLHA